MPYSVEHLIENQGTIVFAHKGDSLTHALEQMVDHDFSQLPVVDEGGHLLGMITYESIMRATRSFNTKVDKLSVRDVLVNAPTHYLDDDLFDLLDELKDTNAVVIIDPDKVPVGIVTSYDASEFLRDRTEDLMHVEDVEFTLKELIKKSYTKSNGELDTEKLQAASARLYEQRADQPARKPKPFDDLTLGDYINLLMSKDVWNFCISILDFDKASLSELLEKVRQVRNDLAHFRKEISARNRDELKYCANWLKSRYQEYEKKQKGILVDELFKQPSKIETVIAVREQPSEYKYKKISTHPKEGRSNQSRYAALANWLAQQHEDEVVLTFDQIEEIIRSPLPDSALQLRAWWANDRVGHYHSILWLEAGWKVTYVNFDEKFVFFARTSSDGKTS
jgi:hypothetical protein